MPKFSGRVHSIVYDNAAQGFYILKMVLDDSNTIETVRGSVSGLNISIGTWFTFEANWDNHAQYGKQLAITKAPIIETWDSEAAANILAANGVGERIVQKLKIQFGQDLITILDGGDPTPLEVVEGITPIISLHIMTRWKVSKAYFQTLDFLSDVGIPKHRINQVWSTFKDNAEEILSTNPWNLVQIDGITFQQVDAVAQKLNLDMTSPLRLQGAIRYVMKTCRGMGHLYMTSGEIMGAVEGLIGRVTVQDLGAGLAHLHKTGAIVIDKKTRYGLTAIYEPWLHMVEQEAAKLLVERMKEASLDKDLEAKLQYMASLSNVGHRSHDFFEKNAEDIQGLAVAALEDWSEGSKIQLSEKQMKGAVNALTEPVSIITGKPGTGKTLSLKAIIRILKDAEVSFLLIAPTGIAAKRINSVTGAPAATIHRAFGAKGLSDDEEREVSYAGITGNSSGLEGSDGSGELWKCSGSPHMADVIICDETSMVDQHLLYRILSCTKPTARLVFIGDDAQLPSVGPGNVLRDMIQAQMFPTVALTEIFRQKDTSQIVVAAHAIHAGEIPEVSSSLKDDFVLVQSPTEEQTLDVVVRLADALYKKRENFQVMSPRHSGVIGVTHMNAKLRELLNPKQPGLQEMKVGNDLIREDDRVMVVQNNYDLEIFNGDVGKVSRINRKTKEIEIKLHGPPVQYVPIPFKDAADYLRLAYVTTVHKMQGQEADNIILPIMNSFQNQLQRNLLYTAITRAKKRVILVGQYEAMVRAIQNAHTDARNTLFLDRLLNTKDS